jgi:hypothetical protein
MRVTAGAFVFVLVCGGAINGVNGRDGDGVALLMPLLLLAVVLAIMVPLVRALNINLKDAGGVDVAIIVVVVVVAVAGDDGVVDIEGAGGGVIAVAAAVRGHNMIHHYTVTRQSQERIRDITTRLSLSLSLTATADKRGRERWMDWKESE